MTPALEMPSDFDMIIQNKPKRKKSQILFEYPNIQPNNAILGELGKFRYLN